jgi:hypothetical protein
VSQSEHIAKQAGTTITGMGVTKQGNVTARASHIISHAQLLFLNVLERPYFASH